MVVAVGPDAHRVEVAAPQRGDDGLELLGALGDRSGGGPHVLAQLVASPVEHGERGPQAGPEALVERPLVELGERLGLERLDGGPGERGVQLTGAGAEQRRPLAHATDQLRAAPGVAGRGQVQLGLGLEGWHRLGEHGVVEAAEMVERELPRVALVGHEAQRDADGVDLVAGPAPVDGAEHRGDLAEPLALEVAAHLGVGVDAAVDPAEQLEDDVAEHHRAVRLLHPEDPGVTVGLQGTQGGPELPVGVGGHAAGRAPVEEHAPQDPGGGLLVGHGVGDELVAGEAGDHGVGMKGLDDAGPLAGEPGQWHGVEVAIAVEVGDADHRQHEVGAAPVAERLHLGQAASG